MSKTTEEDIASYRDQMRPSPAALEALENGALAKPWAELTIEERGFSKQISDAAIGQEIHLGILPAGDVLTQEKLTAMIEALPHRPLTGADVFKPAQWPDMEAHWKHVDDQLREYERAERLAREALSKMDQHLPPGAAERKGMPVATGFIDYFPDAIAAIATLSRIGNDQHNPGKPLHWDRSKSGDESDALMRHFLDRGQFDTDGVRHSAKVAWRAMALLQKEIEAAKAKLEPIFK